MNLQLSRFSKLLPIFLAAVFLLTSQPALAETQFYSDNSTRQDPLQRQKLAGDIAVSEFTGALTYQYPIALPPGRNGLTPSLALTHNSQDKSIYNQVGYHWSLTEYFISRTNKKGVDQMYEWDDFIVNTPFSSGELVELEEGIFGEKIENSFARYEKMPDNSWLVTDKRGNTYKFGLTGTARQSDPANPENTFKWMLEEIRDSNDNFIRYSYQKRDNQIYPQKILYTGHGSEDGVFEVRFNLENSFRDDKQFSYASGFLVETNFLIDSIEVRVDDQKRREYQLEYLKIDPIVRNTLASIAETSYSEGGQPISLPITSFEYTPSVVSWNKVSEYEPPYIFYNCWYDTPCSEIEKLIFWDLTGDGLPDLVNGSDLYINDAKGGWNKVSASGYNVPGGKFPGMGQKLTDFDGDALSDYFSVYSTPEHQLKSYVRLSDGATLQDVIPIYFGDGSSSFPSNGSSVADLNGDSLPDIIQARSMLDNTQHTILSQDTCLNTGGSSCELTDLWHSPIAFVSDNITYQHPRTVYAEDCNSDGLADISGYLNDGKGGWQSMSGDLSCSFTQPDTITYRSADVNGDGLIDRIRAELETTYSGYLGHNEVRLNTGSGWSDDIANFPNYLNVGPYMHVSPGMGTRILDINGDLLPDVYQSYKYIKNSTNSNPDEVIEEKNLWLNTGSRPYFLKTVRTSTGGKIDLEYKTSAQYIKPDGMQANPNLPIIIDTVSKMTVDDGQGNVSETNYFYEDGHYYYENAYDKAFAGFRVVTKTDGLGYKTKSYYHQSQYSVPDSANGEYTDHISKKGRAYRSESYDKSDQLVSATVNRFEHKVLGADHYFPYLSQTLSQTFDGGLSKATAKHYAYDEIGNVIQVIDYGEVNVSAQNGSFSDTGNDLLKTFISYIANSALPYEQKVESQSGALLKHSRTYYDGLVLGQKDKGNITAQEAWLDNPNGWLRSEVEYNEYGLPTRSTNPRGFSSTTEYDAYNLYPFKVCNTKSQCAESTYDPHIGKSIYSKGPNGSITETDYDGLGRPVRVEKDGQLISTNEYNDSAEPRFVHSTAYNDDGTEVKSYTYLDALDRKIESKQEAPAGKWITNQIIYDERGNVKKQIQPYYANGSGFESLDASKIGNSFTYDARGRVLTSVNPLGVTSNVYAGWSVTSTDPNGNSKTFANDARGNLIRVDERNGGQLYSTHYTYDPLGSLTQIRDAENNIRTFAYDSLGRRTFQSKLGSSQGWGYEYDQNSNLTKKTDPMAQVTTMTYDELDRVLSENDMVFAYDQGDYAIGRLSKVWKPGYEHRFTYDAWGRVTNDHKQIQDKGFDFAYTYDRMGAVTSLTYPDGATADYRFDSAHQLEALEVNGDTFADTFSYTPMGQITQMTLGNGVTIQNEYDENQLYRLTSKTATDGLQDYSYTYDPVGNLQSMVDANTGLTAKTVEYQYDDLYRLTQADYQNTANQADLTQTYNYDSLGNMIFKSDVGQFVYDGQHPHAVTQAGSHLYEYDANGNMTVRDADSMTYDYRDRLTLSAGKASFTYGEGYERLTKTDLAAGGTTYYPAKYFEVHPEKEVKYIYAGDLRIAKIEKVLAMITPPPDPDPNPDPAPDPGTPIPPTDSPTDPQPTISNVSEQGTGPVSGGSGGYASQDELELMLLIREGQMEKAQELSRQIYLYTLNSIEKEKEETLIAGALPESPFDNLHVTYSKNSAVIVWDTMPKEITAFRIYRTKGTHATPLEDAEVFLEEIEASRFNNRFVHQFDKPDAKYAYQIEALNAKGWSLLKSQKLHANQIFISEGQEKLVDFKDFSDSDFTHVRIKSNTFIDGRETNNPQRLLLKPDADLTAGARLSVNFLSCDLKEDGSKICKKTDSQFIEVYVLNRSKPIQQTISFLRKQADRLAAALIPKAHADIGDEETYYLLTDHLGSIDVVLDEEGNVVERRDYLPYGSERLSDSQPDATTTDHKFTGKELDDETGLHYYGARYYDSEIGRFVSVDPWKGDLRDPQSLNKYAYTRNNPIIYIDPTGMEYRLIDLIVPPAYAPAEDGQPDDYSSLSGTNQCLLSDSESGTNPFSFALEVAPGTGDANDVYSATTGTSAITGEELSTGERLLAGAAIPLPIVSGHLLSNLLQKADNVIDDVIQETLQYVNKDKPNFTSSHTLTESEILDAGEKFLGPNYTEIGGNGSGVFRSKSGTAQFRIDNGSIDAADGNAHASFEHLDNSGKVITNNHVKIEQD